MPCVSLHHNAVSEKSLTAFFFESCHMRIRFLFRSLQSGRLRFIEEKLFGNSVFSSFLMYVAASPYSLVYRDFE